MKLDRASLVVSEKAREKRGRDTHTGIRRYICNVECLKL